MSETEPGKVEKEDEGFGISSEAVSLVQNLLEGDEAEHVDQQLEDLHAADIADLIEQLPNQAQDKLIPSLCEDLDPEILLHIDDPLRIKFFDVLDDTALANSLAKLDSDDALYLVEDLSEDLQQQVLDRLPGPTRHLVEEGLTFPEDSAGRLMQREFVSVPQFWSVGRTLEFLRNSEGSLPEDFSNIFVLNPRHQVVGAVSLSKMVGQNLTVRMVDILNTDIHPITAATDQEEVGFLFRQYHLLSAPVVDDGGRLIGVITVDDVVDVIDEEAGEDILKLAGIGESTLHRALWGTVRARISWLFVNLITALLASLVIGLFEATLQEIVALAILMPIVASMGGNAGTQTLTIAVRALATKELSGANAWRIIGKESMVGAINGAFFAIISGICATLWFQDWMIGGVIAFAMVLNMIVAGFFGAVIPFALSRMKIDPAIASTVFLTTVTDVIGFVVFLGLGSWFLVQ